MTAVEFGLLLPSREAVAWGPTKAVDVVELAVAAEAGGWDAVWAGDSILARPRLDPVPLLAAAAARTSRVRLGTAVYLPLLRPPLVGAHLLGSLDQLSGGRLVVGVGPGASIPATDAELRDVGVPVGRRVDRLLETVDRWRSAWRDQVGLPPASVEGPQLWLAAAGPRMLRLAGERFDGWIPYTPTPHGYADALAVVREAAGARPVTAAVYLTVTIGEADAATAELDAYLTGYYGVGLELMGQVQACFAGPSEAAAEWIGAFVDAGAEHVVVRLGHRDLGVHAAISEELRRRLVQPRTGATPPGG